MLHMTHRAAVMGRQHVNGQDTPILAISKEIAYPVQIDYKYHRCP